MSDGGVEYWELALDYPHRPRPRFGHDLPPHPRLERIIAGGRDRYAALLRSFLRHRAELLAIPSGDYPGPTEAWWRCGWLPGPDALALYCMVAQVQPSLYIEVGSGCSTTFARRAVADGSIPCRIVSIDPEPRDEIDDICDKVIRLPLEEIELSMFARLGPGDVLFIDGSHRSLMNSDATIVFLEILPELAPGVMVQLHDVFLPWDYPPEWHDRFYSEQYLLAASLLAAPDAFEIVLPLWYVGHDPELASILDPILATPALADVRKDGSSFWMKTRRR